MPQNNLKASKKIGKYFQENSNQALIIGIFFVSFCFIIFGFWIYTVAFLILKEPSATDVIQKRLKVDAKQYQEVIQYINNNLNSQVPKFDKDPFE